jgi:hypothetical protein
MPPKKAVKSASSNSDAKDDSARKAAREYMETLKSKKKTAIATPTRATRGRKSNKTPEMMDSSSEEEEEEEEELPFRRGRTNSRMADVNAAVAKANAVSAGIQLTRKRKDHPTEVLEASPAPARRGSSRTPPVAATSRSKSPVSRASPKVVTNASAALRLKAAQSANSSSPYAGVGYSVSSKSSPVPVQKARSSTPEIAARKRAEIQIAKVRARQAEVEVDDDITIEHIPLPRENTRGVRFSGNKQENVVFVEAPEGEFLGGMTSDEFFKSQPKIFEYLDFIIVAIVIGFGAYLLSFGGESNSNNNDATNSEKKNEDGGMNTTVFVVFALFFMFAIMIMTGTTNWLMSCMLDPNSSNDNAEYKSADTYAPTTHSPVRSAGTAGILRTGDANRRLSAGNTPGKALLDRSRSPTRQEQTEQSEKSETSIWSTIDMIRENLFMVGISLILLLSLLSFLTFPSAVSLYSGISASIVSICVYFWYVSHKKSAHEQVIDNLAKAVKNKLKSLGPNQTYDNEILLEDFKDHADDGRWPPNTPANVKKLTSRNLMNLWDQVMAAVKTDKRVHSSTSTSTAGKASEHLQFTSGANGRPLHSSSGYGQSSHYTSTLSGSGIGRSPRPY